MKPPHRPSSRPRLKPLGQPKAVVVRTDEHGEPVHVRIPGKPARRVAVVRERWRIDDEWWRRPISRRYALLALEDGRTVAVYLDLLEDRWYLQEG